jgi:hypothetical protein
MRKPQEGKKRDEEARRGREEEAARERRGGRWEGKMKHIR